jgi:hypothetical protein
VVSFGVRTLLLLFATLIFVYAVFTEDNYADLLAWGLAALSFSFLLADLGWDRKYGARR